MDGQKMMNVRVPSTVSTLGDLVKWVATELVTQRHDLFVVKDTVRPGVLVLVNDVDWELEGTTAYRLKAHDDISFISTLHGG